MTVDSNNALYGGDEKFIMELNSIASSVLNDLLDVLKMLGDEMQFKKQVSFHNYSQPSKPRVFHFNFEGRKLKFIYFLTNHRVN